MEIYNILYDFFGFELLTESSTLIDFLNCGFKVGLAVFITCYFIKGFFVLFGVLGNGSVGNW